MPYLHARMVNAYEEGLPDSLPGVRAARLTQPVRGTGQDWRENGGRLAPEWVRSGWADCNQDYRPRHGTSGIAARPRPARSAPGPRLQGRSRKGASSNVLDIVPWFDPARGRALRRCALAPCANGRNGHRQRRIVGRIVGYCQGHAVRNAGKARDERLR